MLEPKHEILFAQRRDGADHFSECRASLEYSGTCALLIVQALDEEKQRQFSRGVDLGQFTDVVLTERSDSLFVIKLSHRINSCGALRLVCEDPDQAQRWFLTLKSIVSGVSVQEKVWNALQSSACDSGDWGARLSRIISGLDSSALQNICEFPRNGRLLLHEVSMLAGEGQSLSVQQLNMLRNVLEANVVAASRPNSDGFLPLHLLLRSLFERGADKEQLESQASSGNARFVEAAMLVANEYPEALFEAVPGAEGGLPIHLACGARLSGLVQAFVNLDDPFSRINDFLGDEGQLLKRDDSFRTPLHCLIESRTKLNLSSPKENRLDDDEGLGLCSLLVTIEPLAAFMQDEKGDTAIHIAARHGDHEVLRCMVENLGLEQCKTVTNDRGETPTKLLLRLQNDLARAGKSQELFQVERTLLVMRVGLGLEYTCRVLGYDSSQSRKDYDSECLSKYGSDSSDSYHCTAEESSLATLSPAQVLELI